MYTADVIKHFGSKTLAAKAAGVSESAVSQWKELVPPLSAARLAKRTNGRLKFDIDLYNGWNNKSRSVSSSVSS